MSHMSSCVESVYVPDIILHETDFDPIPAPGHGRHTTPHDDFRRIFLIFFRPGAPLLDDLHFANTAVPLMTSHRDLNAGPVRDLYASWVRVERGGSIITYHSISMRCDACYERTSEALSWRRGARNIAVRGAERYGDLILTGGGAGRKGSRRGRYTPPPEGFGPLNLS